MLAAMRARTCAAFGTTAPYPPECRSVWPVWMINSTAASPLKEIQSAPVSPSYMPPSQDMTTSAVNSSFMAPTAAGALGLPISSSPSQRKVRLIGGAQVGLVAASPDGRIEWIRKPFGERVDRLHVIVAVNEDRRCPRRRVPLAVDEWMPRRFDEAHFGDSDRAHSLGYPIGADSHISGMVR